MTSSVLSLTMLHIDALLNHTFMCITGRVFMQRRHNGRRHQHRHYHEEEENDPVSKKPVTYNFIVFTHTCMHPWRPRGW